MEEQHVTAQEMGAFLGMTGRRVEQLVREGILVKAKRGQYPLGENTRRLLTHMRQEAGSEDRDILLEIRKIRLERERLKSQIANGDLVSREAYETFIVAVREAGEKAIQLMERHLVGGLKRAGIQNPVAHAIPVLNACDESFCKWQQAAVGMIIAGATSDQVKTFLFNTHSTPPSGPVRFTETRARKSRAEEEE